MSRTIDTIVASIRAKLHRGFVVPRKGGVMDALFRSAASEIALIERDAEAMMDEVDPRTASLFLADFERVLGPDPCGRDRNDLSLRQRQQIAHQRWTAVGGQSIPYLIATAAKLGFNIEIEEFWPSKAGRLRAGQRLIPEGEQFVWRVKLALNKAVNFKAKTGQAGQPLGEFIPAGVECELRRIAHAHTRPVFNYTLENN